MTTGAVVLARIVPAVVGLLEAVVEQAVASDAQPTLYDLEALTQAVLAPVGQVVLQELTVAQGSGLVGPSRPCACGEEQTYHDQARRLVVQTSVGAVHLEQRAYYRCAVCHASSCPLDEQLGLGQAGRMSRYLQEQCAWLLALLPGKVGQQTLVRFGWPAVSASEVRAKGEALGAELDAREQQRVAALQAAAGAATEQQLPIRQPAQGSRLYAAPDVLKYCTTTREEQTGKLMWRELKAAAIYEVVPSPPPEPVPGQQERPSLRTRLQTYQATYAPGWTLAPADQAVRISYVARTEPYDRFGAFLWAELRERGLGAPVRDLAVVADGSPHLETVVEQQLRLPDLQLTHILDLPHAQGQLWAASKAIFGDGEAGKRWVQAPLLALERGQVAQVCAALTALAEAHTERAPEAAKTARTAATYFADRAAQLDYPTFLAQGYQVGSGLAESACKRFGTDRMKGAGMRWTIPGAQQVAPLRMLLLSDRWQEVSDHLRTAA